MLSAGAVRSLCAALTLLATAAAAQPDLENSSYWDRCYGTYQGQPTWVFLGNFYSGPQPSAPPPSHPSAPVSGGSPLGGVPGVGGGEGAAYALLVGAVVALIALPVVVYVVDDNPSPRVIRNFRCPSFAFDGWGGGEGGVSGGNSQWAAMAAGRIRIAVSHFGTDLQFDASPAGIGSFSVHGVVRPTPKEHLEVGVALGYQRSYVGGQMREGFEAGVPQLYSLWRSEGRALQLELRPGVFITTRKTVDVSVDLAVLIPVLEVMSIRLGARAYSYDLQPRFGFNAGLSVHL